MVTLMNENDLLTEFMLKTNRFFKENTDFQILGYNESPTVSNKVIRLSVFLGEKDYDAQSDMYSYARELGDYLEKHFPEVPQTIAMPCPECSKDGYPS